MCDEIINAPDSLSTDVTDTILTNVTNTLSTNVTNILSKNVPSTVPINSDDKKVRYEIDCYISHTFLLVICFRNC